MIVALSAALVGVSLIVGAAGAHAASATKITKGGNFTQIAIADVPSFDPTKMGSYAIGNTAAIANNVYGSLIYLDRNTGKQSPGLLLSVTGSPDAITWTMKVRPNVKFSDGTTFDAAAIKANVDYHAASATSAGKSFADAIGTWDVSDPMVAKVTLKAADSTFALNLINRMDFMASPTAISKYGDSYGSSPETTVGAGPFTLETWTRGSKIVFTRNAKYWDSPRPYLDTSTVMIIADPQQGYNTLLTGGADTMQSPSQAIQDQAKTAGMRIEQYYPNTVSFRPQYFMNLTKPPFDDPVARQAVVVALDPKVVAAAADRPIAKSIYDKGSTWYSPNGTFPKYDPKKAQSLIDQWSSKNGGAPLEFTVTDVVGNTTIGGQGETIQAAFADYKNVKVNVQQVTQAALTTMGPAGDFQLYPSAIGGIDPTGFMNANYMTGGSRNFGKYSNPQMDAALKAKLGTTIFKEQKDAYDTTQTLLMKDMPSWFIPVVGFATNHWLVSNKAVQNWGGGYTTGPMVSDIWIKNSK